MKILVLFLAIGICDGIVFDAKTNERLFGVKVTSKSDTTYTNLDGSYSLRNIDTQDTIKFEYISYKKTTIVIN